MDLTFTNKQTAFRQEIHDWLAVNVPAQPLQTFDTAEGFAQHREWEATLNKGRWGMVTWPEELGGRGCDLIEWLIFEEEYYRARAPLRVNQNGIFLLGPTLMEYGTEEQKARILPKMASGEEVWAQGWSEPNAGSDMAAIRSTARLEGDKYVINGQKTWSTRAVLVFRHVPHGPRFRAPPRPDLYPGATGQPRHHRAAHSATGRPAGFCRDLLR
jgi:alkylation response protein AidB-like acyl-CoA dehydrogenase